MNLYFHTTAAKYYLRFYFFCFLQTFHLQITKFLGKFDISFSLKSKCFLQTEKFY